MIDIDGGSGSWHGGCGGVGIGMVRGRCGGTQGVMRLSREPLLVSLVVYFLLTGVFLRKNGSFKQLYS